MAGYCDTQQRLNTRNKDFQSNSLNSYLQSSQDFAVTLRKSKRQSIQTQKRLKSSSSSLDPIPNDQINFYLSHSLSRSEAFSSIIDLIGSNTETKLILLGLKNSLHQKYNNIPGEDIRPEHINRLISLLDDSETEFSEIILEILINLSYYFEHSMNQCLNKRAIPVFSKFFNSENEDLCTDMIWFITNASRSNYQLKNSLLTGGFVESLIKILKNLKKESSVNIVVWSLSLMIKDYDQISENEGLGLANHLKHLLRYEDEEIKRFSLIILFYLGYHDTRYLEFYYSYGMLNEIFNLLKSDNSKIVLNALKIFNLVIWKDSGTHTQQLIDLGLLNKLSKLSANSNYSIRKEAYFCYSNLASSTHSHRRLIIKDYFFTSLLNGLVDENLEVREEACNLISNISQSCIQTDFSLLFNQGFFSKIVEIFKLNDNIIGNIGKDLLVSIGKIIKHASCDELAELRTNGFQDLIILLSSVDETEDVAGEILENYFSYKEVPIMETQKFSIS